MIKGNKLLEGLLVLLMMYWIFVFFQILFENSCFACTLYDLLHSYTVNMDPSGQGSGSGQNQWNDLMGYGFGPNPPPHEDFSAAALAATYYQADNSNLNSDNSGQTSNYNTTTQNTTTQNTTTQNTTNTQNTNAADASDEGTGTPFHDASNVMTDPYNTDLDYDHPNTNNVTLFDEAGNEICPVTGEFIQFNGNCPTHLTHVCGPINAPRTTHDPQGVWDTVMCKLRPLSVRQRLINENMGVIPEFKGTYNYAEKWRMYRKYSQALEKFRHNPYDMMIKDLGLTTREKNYIRHKVIDTMPPRYGWRYKNINIDFFTVMNKPYLKEILENLRKYR